MIDGGGHGGLREVIRTPARLWQTGRPTCLLILILPEVLRTKVTVSFVVSKQICVFVC